MKPSLSDRFTVTGECWIWTAARNGDSGQYSYRVAGERRRLPAHVAVWLDTGHEPIGRNVLTSTCGHDLCVRPEHREPVTVKYLRRPDLAAQVESFWARVDKGRGCWEWTGGRGDRGYGHVNYDGERWGTHRLAYYLTHLVEPGALFVRHDCDNPPCCRPDHLLLGTAADNTADMFRRGRQHRRDGIYSSQSKLTAEQVRTIRCEVAAGTVQRRFAERYGISVMAVSRIVRGQTYRNV